ncbi:hypothetical protein ESCO_004506 [Escovopsis weberi]|uniref:Uncharacterized protein n=1 Tax=Escovopsis weberi TaxID=150374 RepID=A0A0M9VVF6_ESCWE|nr:hypothetical protein ESCO_004506 [Escovopsis weberi]
MCLLTCIPTAGESYPPAASFSNPQPLNSTTVADQMSTATAISLGMSISFVLFLFAGLYILRHVKLQPNEKQRRHRQKTLGNVNDTVMITGSSA